jgi:methylmalonyl-CoA mutase
VESLPCDLLIESDSSTHLRAERLAITSQLILQSESGLGEVIDPSSGSFSIEEMTLNFAKVSWETMQKMILLSPAEQSDFIQAESRKNWLEIQKRFSTRKKVQTGINDFSNPSEVVSPSKRWLKADHVRLGRAFEELRLQFKKSKPSVCMAVVGDYAALQPRLNFAKNYFELLGLNVIESGHSQNASDSIDWLKNQKSEIKVWVSSDEDHLKLSAVGERCYIAGKTQVSGCLNLFSGQDVYDTLLEIFNWWESRQ